MKNTYSTTWFEIFLEPEDSVRTAAEVDFLASHLPLPRYRNVVDLCCGTGRHASALAHAGYRVTAVDNNTEAIEAAVARSGDVATYVPLDMRAICQLQGPFDAFINLWQSFGYFDAQTNREILAEIGRQLTSGGRLILDVYHRDFFERHQGERTFERAGVIVRERKQMVGRRLKVALTYANTSHTDEFEWQLYTPAELISELEALGFRCLTACTGFRADCPVTAEQPRMQLVFEEACRRSPLRPAG